MVGGVRRRAEKPKDDNISAIRILVRRGPLERFGVQGSVLEGGTLFAEVKFGAEDCRFRL